MKIGTRVQLKHEVWRYPHFIAERGERGTVVLSDGESVHVKMDNLIDGAEEWDNEVHWYGLNDRPGIAADDFAGDVDPICADCGKVLSDEDLRSTDPLRCDSCEMQASYDRSSS